MSLRGTRDARVQALPRVRCGSTKGTPGLYQGYAGALPRVRQRTLPRVRQRAWRGLRQDQRPMDWEGCLPAAARRCGNAAGGAGLRRGWGRDRRCGDGGGVASAGPCEAFRKPVPFLARHGGGAWRPHRAPALLRGLRSPHPAARPARALGGRLLRAPPAGVRGVSASARR